MSAFPFQLGCSPAILFWTRNETRYRRRRRRRYLDFSVVYRLTTLTRVTQTCCGPLVERNYVLQGGRVSFDWRTTQPLKPAFMHDMIGRAAGSPSCMLFLCWIQIIHLIGYETRVKKKRRIVLRLMDCMLVGANQRSFVVGHKKLVRSRDSSATFQDHHAILFC